MKLGRGLLTMVVVAVLGAGMTACQPPPKPFCYLSGTSGLETFRWDGGGDNLHWGDARNWDRNKVPGTVGDTPYNDVACIPSGNRVMIGGGGEVRIVSLDSQGELLVGDPDNPDLNNIGGKLYLLGDPATRFSRASTLRVISSTLGGRNQITISTLLQFRNRAGAPEHTGANPGAATGTGKTIIGTGATMVVTGDGQNTPGSNFTHGRTVENLGTTVLRNFGNISADTDTGTTFINRGTFVFENDKGYYEGTINSPAGTAPELSAFENRGRIWKAQGTGTSIIAARYSDVGGTVDVSSGRISILSDNADGTVAPGSTLSTGACPVQGCTTPLATPGDQQTTAVRLPLISGANPADVVISEFGSAGDYPQVSVSTADFPATTTNPMRFTLVVDASTRQGVALSGIVVKQGGVAVANCTNALGTNAAPNPCVRKTQESTTGDVSLAIFTTQNAAPSSGQLRPAAVVPRSYTITGPRLH